MSLKELTTEKHVAAEAHPFTKLLISGNMPKEVYADYLLNQHMAYLALEDLASSNNLLAGIEPIRRANAIRNDLQELGITDKLKIYPATIKYVDHLATLTPQELMANIYVRHMGDMYGGQMIKKVIPGSGTMYNFQNRSDLAAELRTRLTDDMAVEANVCFDLILELFTELANEHNIQ